ncbi:MAG TPA: hypothetical protein VNS52_13910 [Gemmatimonadaceae bacterium]|nr:hypothetical protein [Gemmatimonadaceae bacterium]
MPTLWSSTSLDAWRRALDSYEAVVARQGVARLAELDAWYRDDLPPAIAARRHAHVTLAELVKVTEWKMARGVWRGRNLALVRGNAPDVVIATSTEALAAMPDPTAPIATLAELDGVGPATASAVAAAAMPDVYPFFDELVAAQMGLAGKLAFTLGYYAKYAAALRERAGQLGHGWTPVMVERALWAHVGGKAGVASGG